MADNRQTDRVADLRSQIEVGMDVFGSDSEKVGTVKETYDVNFRIDRSFQTDVNVPYQAIRAVTDDGVVLSIPGDAVERDIEDVANPKFFPGAPPIMRRQ